jgi:hypothetical protein
VLAIATLGLTWNFSSAENLESLNLQVRPRSGTIITRPATHPVAYIESDITWNILATTYWIELKL